MNTEALNNSSVGPLAKIEAIDVTLKTLTEAWTDAAPKNAEKWRVKIDEVLDSRIEQMALRDAQPTAA